jgi:hypothetical protein
MSGRRPHDLAHPLRRAFAGLAIGTLFVICVLSGCAGGRANSLALKAEERGEPQVAYEYYCRAAGDNPGSGAIAGGLARVRAGASAYWESRALLEMDSGHYDDAWRMLMKALEIQPDASTTASLIRQIESQHSDQIALARMDWQRRGTTALASAIGGRRGSPPPPVDSTPTDVEAPDIAESEPQLPTETQTTQEPAADTRVAAATPRVEETLFSRPPPISSPIEPVRPGHDAWNPQAGPSSKRLPEASDQETIEPPPRREPLPEPAPIDSTEPPDEPQRRPARPPLTGAPSDYLIIQSLSLKDRTYPKIAVTVEGVQLRLRDTDSDLEADFDLYAGRTRIKKIRGLKIGRSQLFSGANGVPYRLTLLGIHHKSRTVRVGIKPA